MHKILKFAKREYLAAVKTKGFIIGLILAPIVMSGSLIAFLLLKDNVDLTDKTIAIIDRSGRVNERLIDAARERNKNEIFDPETGNKIKPAYYLKAIEADRENADGQRLVLSDRVRSGELHAFLEIGEHVVHPAGKENGTFIRYYGKNTAMDELRRWIVWPINNHLRQVRLADAGIDQSRVEDLFQWINVDGMGLVTVDEQTGSITDAQKADELHALLVPIVMMMLLFLMMMMSVPGMLNSVMEEKTQRIAEVVLGSVKPFEFMMAKLVGGIAVSLTSSVVYILAALIAVYYMDLTHFFPFHVLPWFFIYMLLAIIMYGALSAALGATCSEAKDAQSLTFPAILPALVTMFVYFPVVKEPLSSFSTWMSMIPLFSPMLMVLRLSTPETIPAWQPYLALAGVVICTIFFVWAGGRIFRVAILMQGTPPKFANIVRWAIRG